jgi:hypothetical protein
MYTPPPVLDHIHAVAKSVCCPADYTAIRTLATTVDVIGRSVSLL